MKKALPILGVLLVIGGICAAVFWPRSDKDAKLEVVRFGSFSTAVDYGPYLVAKDKKWFDEVAQKHGAKTEYTVFQSLPPINESFATGRVDVVFEAEAPAIVGRAAGIDLKIVAASCALVQEVLVPTDSPVKTVADLKGKKIAILAGTSSHYGVVKMLTAQNIDPKSVEVVDMVPPDAKGAFATRKVDAWAVWPPWVEQEELSGAGRVLAGTDAKIQSIMAARGEFGRKYPQLLKDLTGVLERSKKWMAENPDEAQKILAKELNVPLEVVRKAWPRHDWAFTLTPDAVTDIQAKADFLSTNGFVKKRVDVAAELVDLGYRP